ncbi:glycosyltransferase [Pseudobacteriovorax antillogorgiicola]|uniref:Glycosyltransferase involved in cell wall bisynthesis n=1 Tax=Pseudobacteriovorax antillogorgiicola TaxID=1513793 RepID=A0A1Y6BBT3_9BACT|nr:glycosyltransferase [Pseudobacteriovorax antillogorgiicola]TCS57404.1 glycosyltransferase involved in cell wall biosynthesis [Pseudobacteriovorax antillogorgiicola]SMF01559.1 Glycosyltransferase involved in cell wall bisynthesis [Pseudobacteriovorax antillogorgiicola]
MSLKIAIFTEVFLPKIDGITNRLMNTIRELKRMGHDVVVFAPDNAVDEFEGSPVVKTKSFHFRPYPGVKLTYPSPRILKQLRQHKPDLVHVVGPAVTGLWGTLCARFLGVPIVSSYHTDFPNYAQKYGLGFIKPLVWMLVRRIHNLAQINLCPSSATSKELTENRIKDVRIWRGGVDARLFHPSRCCNNMRFKLTGGKTEGPLAVYVGRLGHEKGLDAIEPLLQAVPDLRFAIIGDGPARRRLESRLPSDRVTFMGFLRGEELAKAYASADFFFMPSQTETLGFVTMEAICSGLPVVAADAGGTQGIIDHGRNGFLYQPNRVDEAASYFRQLIDDPDLRTKIKKYGLSQAQGFSWAQETMSLLSQYAEILQRSSQPAIKKKVKQLKLPLASYHVPSMYHHP